MINWKVRIKNKSFWIALIPAVLLLVQVIAAVFGYTLNLGELGDKLLAVVNALFAVLTILGIVTDPTTAGIGDSKQALTYETPKKEDAVYPTSSTMKTNPTQCFTKKNEFGFALFGGARATVLEPRRSSCCGTMSSSELPYKAKEPRRVLGLS